MVDQRFSEIKNTHISAISKSLWTLNYEMTRVQINGIATISEIEFVELKSTANDSTFNAGNLRSKNLITAELPILNNRLNGEPKLLGRLYLYASKDDIFDRLLNRVIIILLSNGVKTFIVAGFILFFRIGNSAVIKFFDLKLPALKVESFSVDSSSTNSISDIAAMPFI